MEKELTEKLLELSKRGISLEDLCEELELNKLEVLGIVGQLRDEGINISTKIKDDGFYMFNKGEIDDTDDDILKIKTDENNEFKFVAFSDTRIGSKYQQLSILNDIYEKAYLYGYKNVFICGNITEGIYPITNKYAEYNFLDDSLKQVNYITDNFPSVEGIKTYFITGAKDSSHLKKNKINIGKRISNLRSDMIFLGDNSSIVEIDKVKMMIFNPTLGKTYTVSYRPQQQIDSFRSEDKPDILLFGGQLNMQKFEYRNVHCIATPSVVATTKEFNDKRYSNDVGAWFITVKTNKKGELESVRAIICPYYKTIKRDYVKTKKLILTGETNEKERI